MLKHLSATSLSMYQRCGIQFQFRYMDKIKAPPGVAMISGASVHKGAEEDLKTLMSEDTHMSQTDVVNIAVNYYEENVWEAEESKKEKDDAKNNTVKRAQLWYDELSHQYNPIAVEKKIILNLDDVEVPIIGYIDVLENNVIRDIKSGNRAKSQGDADGSLQLSIYDLAENLIGHDIQFLQFDMVTNSKAYPIITRRSDKTRMNTIRLIQKLWSNIQAGAAIPAQPDDWCCTKKWCGYSNICPYFSGREK